MPYQTLEKAFYADASSSRHSNHETLYLSRLNADSTIRTGIDLQNGELFCAVPMELAATSERILTSECRIASLWDSLPHVAKGAQIRSLVLDEVVYSNEIEGVHSTRRQIEAALAKAESHREEHTPFLELAKLYLGLSETTELPAKPSDIRAIFDAVVDGALSDFDKPDGILFRAGPVHIENNRGKTLHEGIVPEEKIAGLLDQTMEFCRRDDIPHLLSAVLGHFLFEYIHPFYDGNGRTGRYLLALYLSRTLGQTTVLSLSRTIAENKNAYYKGFDAVERPLNRCEATPFAMMLLDLIEQAQDGIVADLEGKSCQLAALRQSLAQFEDDLPERKLETLRYAAQMHMFEAFGETTLTGLAEHLDVSKATASKMLTEWIAEGMLEKLSSRPFVCRLTRNAIDRLQLES